MIRPILDRLWCKQEPAPETEGSIVIPDTAKKKPRRAKVLAVGPGTTESPTTDVKAGDTVLYTNFGGSVYTDRHGDEFIILRMTDVMCVVDE